MYPVITPQSLPQDPAPVSAPGFDPWFWPQKTFPGNVPGIFFCFFLRGGSPVARPWHPDLALYHRTIP